MPDHLSCLLWNLYAGQESTVRTRHRKTDWFQIGKGICQDCILSPCLFNFYAGYIMQNAGLDEAQAGIKIARRNINNLRYADNTNLMAEWEELKSLLMKVKEESEKVGLKLNIQGEELRWRRSRTGRTLHKFIKRTFKSRVNSTKQLLKAGRGHQAPRKATQVFDRR